MSRFYKLINKQAQPVEDFIEWCEWHARADRNVKYTKVGDVQISTVFLGMDHAHFGGPPMLFETMIFGGAFNEDMDRCSTWEQAEEQHKNMVYKVIATTEEV